MHQAVGNSLRALRQWMPHNHLNDAHLLMDTDLANAMYTMHTTFHGGLLWCTYLSRDMVMNIPFVADLTTIQDNCQQLIDERALHSNEHCYAYDYQPGQEVMKLVCKPDNLEP
jgi:hypothetical protein